ncbi:MAG: hypothetical protein IKZ67_03670, partial [Paludibacteraceae bacterium]|nr:hypothetical protein [Paludibacteraceae bacterium]
GYILDVLNYEMSDIFANLGINTEGGEWVYAEKEKVDKSQQADIVVKMNSLGLPISDDYLYDTFGIDKPGNYDEIVRKKAEQQAAMLEALKKQQKEGEGTAEPAPVAESPKPTDKTIYRRILDFFASARTAGDRSMKW